VLTIRHAYRRHLPHYEREGRDYFVTFTTVDRYVLLPEARDLLLSHILFDHLRVMYLHVAVVMTDHAHLILRPYVMLQKIM
jgi:REP element-mobilizing transposase RayT